MVEHLTFGGHHEARYQFNASVEGRYTQYIVESADPADIAAYLRAVCEGLAADHGPILDRERRILRTEAASRGGAGMMGTCLVERYGARGPGVLNYQEFGFERLGWADVAAWRARWFTARERGAVGRGRSAGRPAAIAPGRSRAACARTRSAARSLPAYVTGAKGGIAAGLVTDRSFASHATLDILQRRLTRALRHDHGLTYDVGMGARKWTGITSTPGSPPTRCPSRCRWPRTCCYRPLRPWRRLARRKTNWRPTAAGSRMATSHPRPGRLLQRPGPRHTQREAAPVRGRLDPARRRGDPGRRREDGPVAAGLHAGGGPLRCARHPRPDGPGAVLLGDDHCRRKSA